MGKTGTRWPLLGIEMAAIEELGNAHRNRGDGDEQAEPAQSATVSAVVSIQRNPEVGECEQKQKRSPLDRRQVSTRTECEIKGHQQRDSANENVDDRDLFITDPTKQPETV